MTKKQEPEVFTVSSGTRKINNAVNVLTNTIKNVEKGTKIRNRTNCRWCKYKGERC
jgi:hypothetical protein